MATLDDKIAEAEKKVKQLKAQREAVEARKVHALIKGKRADDTRRKILAGSLVLDMMAKEEATRQRFIERLDKYLTRPDDRALFGLSVLQEQATTSTGKKEKAV